MVFFFKFSTRHVELLASVCIIGDIMQISLKLHVHKFIIDVELEIMYNLSISVVYSYYPNLPIAQFHIYSKIILMVLVESIYSVLTNTFSANCTRENPMKKIL